MSQLIDETGFVADRWTRIDAAELAEMAEPGAHMIVPLAFFPKAARTSDAPIGVHIANDTEPDYVHAVMHAAALISIDFPGFADGRGFSLGKALRDAGYDGILRATGPLIADQFAFALACGFDELEIPDALAARQPEAQWLHARGDIGAHYQMGYGKRRGISGDRMTALEARHTCAKA